VGGALVRGDPGEVPVLRLTWRNVLLWLVIAFVVLLIWNTPTTAGQEIGDFLGDVGSFFLDLIDKVAQFFSGLTEE
jgi:hypothetical protein